MALQGLYVGEMSKVPNFLGQPRIRLEYIPSNTHRLCMPVDQPSMEALRNLIFGSAPQTSEVSKGLRRTSGFRHKNILLAFLMCLPYILPEKY